MSVCVRLNTTQGIINPEYKLSLNSAIVKITYIINNVGG